MEAIDKFIKAIKEHNFIQAHELLEEDWKEYKKQGLKKEAKALQGLINAATALALFYNKKRPEGFKKVWPVYIKYKPLLKQVSFKNMPKYYYASILLEEKKEELINF